jgi:riboflavin transporter FmnP
LLACPALFAGLFLLHITGASRRPAEGVCYYFYKRIGEGNMKQTETKKRVNVRAITWIAMLAAAAFALQLLAAFLPKVGGFLDLEISDLPAIVGTMALGPAAGIVIELIKNLLHCTVTTTGFVGEFANFVMNGTFMLVTGLIYKRNKTKKGAVWALVWGVVSLAVMGVVANMLIMLPLYMPTAPFDVKLILALSTILPFNLVRGAVLSLITLLIYKKLSPIIKGK